MAHAKSVLYVQKKAMVNYLGRMVSSEAVTITIKQLIAPTLKITIANTCTTIGVSPVILADLLSCIV